jgi:hypothetical protein
VLLPAPLHRFHHDPGQELHASVADAKIYTMDQPAFAALHVEVSLARLVPLAIKALVVSHGHHLS